MEVQVKSKQQLAKKYAKSNESLETVSIQLRILLPYLSFVNRVVSYGDIP